MQTKQLSLVISLMLPLCVCPATQAQQAGRIESMKLLTANTGWAATNKKLFFTTDGGTQWKDITPRTKPDRKISSVFFLDLSHGWVLLAHEGKEDPQSGIAETLFEIASTLDAGETWSVTRLELPDPDRSRGLSHQAWLDFVDGKHGWVLVRMNGNTVMNVGVLRATDDGGATWSSLGVPAAGPIRFMSPADGWLDAGANAEFGPALYATRNDGKDWTAITIKAPSEFGPKVYANYRLPDFLDRDSGSILMTFSEPNDEVPKLGLFLTIDGGRTWTPHGAANEGGTSWQTAYAGSEWLAMGCPSREFTVLSRAANKVSESRPSKTTSDTLCARNGGGISQLSFADAIKGWALLFGGELVATSNGGQTWKSITPSGAAAVRPASGQAVEAPARIRGFTKTAPSGLGTSSSNVSTHLGFDKFPVIPKVSDMQLG
jgi:photosystem II stability/assembly factor-like uncharacterized protein